MCISVYHHDLRQLDEENESIILPSERLVRRRLEALGDPEEMIELRERTNNRK